MALVTCPDCRREVSDAAPNCPQCGRPLHSAPIADHQAKRPTNPWMIIGWILLLIILLPLATCVLLVGGGVSSSAYSDYREKSSARSSARPALEVLVNGYEAAARAENVPAMQDYADAIEKHYPGTMLPPVSKAPAKEDFTAD